MDPEPGPERADQALTLILTLLVMVTGVALAVGLIAGGLGLVRPNCPTFVVDRSGTCGTNSATLTRVAPFLPTLDPSRFRLDPSPP